MPPLATALIEACERYLREEPNGQHRAEVAYKAARIYYQYNHLDEATRRLAELAVGEPERQFEGGPRVCSTAGNLLIDAFNFRGDTTKTNEWSCRLSESACAARDTQFKHDMRKLCEQSTFKLATDLDRKKDYLEAAEAFLSFARSFPSSDLAAKAVSNAAIALANAKRVDAAIELRRRFLAEFPRSQLVPATTFLLTEDYESIGAAEKACPYFRAYADNFEKTKGLVPKAGDLIWERPKAEIARSRLSALHCR